MRARAEMRTEIRIKAEIRVEAKPMEKEVLCSYVVDINI
jgi:hypothetical protein